MGVGGARGWWGGGVGSEEPGGVVVGKKQQFICIHFHSLHPLFGVSFSPQTF